MKTLNFKRLHAENFLCFGPEGIDLVLETMGNIVLILGENFDDDLATGRPGSNGAGKSSTMEILVYGLYGKPVKRKLNQKDVVHTKVGKGCRVVVEWDRYRVERCLKPNSLRLWESEAGEWSDRTEITPGAGIPETQRVIEAILGLNYRTFVNVVCFDDRNSTSFLECDGPTKREIVENLLSLDKYRDFGKTAKDLHKEAEREVKDLSLEYTRILQLQDHAAARLDKVRAQQGAWQSQKRAEVEGLIGQAKARRAEAAGLDGASAMASWNEAQDRLTALGREVAILEAKVHESDVVVAGAKVLLANAENSLATARTQENRWAEEKARRVGARDHLRRESVKLRELTPGVVCGTCLAPVDPVHYQVVIAQNDLLVEDAERAIDEAGYAGKAHAEDVVRPAQAAVRAISEGMQQARVLGESRSRELTASRAEIQRLSRLPVPEQATRLRVLEEQIASLKAQATQAMEELAGRDPYRENLRDAEGELEARAGEGRAKKGEVGQAERMVPYYRYWVNAFGDQGIRKFVIEGIVPALNARISHWLDCLIYGNISLTFDNALEETINRVPFDAEEFVYYAMSGGEQRRINLAVTLSFAHVMMLNSGRSPNLIFLDEVAINIDENGIEGVYNMIRQLAQDKKVFVTTHDPTLLSLLQGTTTLRLERRQGFTKRVDSDPRKLD